MSTTIQIVVCARVAPEHMPTLESIASPNGSGLRNEPTLSAAPDSWASHELPAFSQRLRFGLWMRLLCLLTGAFIGSGDGAIAQNATNTGSVLEDLRPGYWLAQTKDLGVWWCESGWKIGRERVLPQHAGRGSLKPVAVSAAQGEYEAVQLILRPERDGQLLSAELGPLRWRWGRTPAISVRIDEVAYVEVTKPTDKTCAPGWYPDPLPPLRTPLALRAGQNQPLWITFRVSRDTKPGSYTAKLTLKTTWGDVRVPVAVQVFDFALPEESHLRSALGLGSGAINQYHRLARAEDKEEVFEKYLQNFAEHRISPYSFFDYAPIDIRFVGEGTDKKAQVDFTKFDRAAAKWLERNHKADSAPSERSGDSEERRARRPENRELRRSAGSPLRASAEGSPFNSFLLPLRGMGGGTFHSRHLGELEGFKEGTPEHARLFQDYLSQIERHLRERGWLDKAYTYWFDEPDRKDYEFVADGMKRIKAAAPGIKRMLTEQPEPKLSGNVEIWCALTPEWTPEKVAARRAAGEEVWWYICTGPKAPYVTEFIDHPGTELRLWPWQSWQYGVGGILIWQTLYWNSATAYPDPQLQDPWQDPMSWQVGYGLASGKKSPWGNGDGRFLYPPRRPLSDTSPCLDGPVNSLRWENLRDGMEDYEYFWLLSREIERVAAAKGDGKLVQEARGLLKIPSEISEDLKHFTTDPRLMLQHREQIARMIERLQRER